MRTSYLLPSLSLFSKKKSGTENSGGQEIGGGENLGHISYASSFGNVQDLSLGTSQNPRSNLGVSSGSRFANPVPVADLSLLRLNSTADLSRSAARSAGNEGTTTSCFSIFLICHFP